MKKITIIFLLVLTIGGIAHANEDLSALNAQGWMLYNAAKSKEAEVDLGIEISVPDYPSFGPIQFREHALIPYNQTKNGVSVKGGDIPEFYNELEDIPESIKPMTLVISVNNRMVKAEWDDDLDLKVSNIDFKISVYKKKKREIKASTKPVVDLVIENVKMKASEVDTDEHYVSFKFDAKLPKSGNELIDKFLAGKKIEGLFSIEYE